MKVYVDSCPFLQSRSIFLQARLFAAGASSPSYVDVHTHTPRPRKPTDPVPPARYPAVEDVIDSFSIQPHAHDVAVCLQHGGAISRFHIFFRRHKRMPPNGFFDLKGDFLVMRTAAADHNSVVNLRSSDGRLIDFFMRK